MFARIWTCQGRVTASRETKHDKLEEGCCVDLVVAVVGSGRLESGVGPGFKAIFSIAVHERSLLDRFVDPNPNLFWALVALVGLGRLGACCFLFKSTSGSCHARATAATFC